MVGIENRNVFTAGMCQCMIDISRLGMSVIATGNVNDAYDRGKVAELLAAAIVEQEDFHFASGILHGQRSQHRGPHNIQRFVVCGYKDVHSWPKLWISG